MDFHEDFSRARYGARGITLGLAGSGTYLMIIGDALVTGAFITAITSFLVLLRGRFFGIDEIAWTGR